MVRSVFRNSTRNMGQMTSLNLFWSDLVETLFLGYIGPSKHNGENPVSKFEPEVGQNDVIR